MNKAKINSKDAIPYNPYTYKGYARLKYLTNIILI
jgi:hypothetical protein